MHAPTLALIALAAVVFAALSRRAEQRFLTPAMVFAGFGFLVGPGVFDLVVLPIDTEAIHALAEIALALTLFVDAARIDVSRLGREHSEPLRMLALGLPLMIALGAGLALLLLPGVGWPLAFLLATVLAPTDAALGQPVVADRRLPVRVRQTLNVESGLNDGLAFPALLVALALVAGTADAGSAAAETRSTADWLQVLGLQLLLGPLAGLAVGYAGALLFEAANRRGWMEPTALRIGLLALAFLAFGGAETIGGNGYLAAFVAGGVMGTRAPDLRETLCAFGETEGQLLSLLVFLAFGVAVMPDVGTLSWPVLLYALASLFLLRLAAVALSLAGSRLRWPSVALFGWFGPRGLASIIYLLIAVREGAVAAGDPIFTAVVVTVVLSILLHGASAGPLAAAYARWVQAPHRSGHHEHTPVHAFALARRALEKAAGRGS